MLFPFLYKRNKYRDICIPEIPWCTGSTIYYNEWLPVFSHASSPTPNHRRDTSKARENPSCRDAFVAEPGVLIGMLCSQRWDPGEIVIEYVQSQW